MYVTIREVKSARNIYIYIYIYIQYVLTVLTESLENDERKMFSDEDTYPWVTRLGDKQSWFYK